MLALVPSKISIFFWRLLMIASGLASRSASAGYLFSLAYCQLHCTCFLKNLNPLFYILKTFPKEIWWALFRGVGWRSSVRYLRLLAIMYFFPAIYTSGVFYRAFFPLSAFFFFLPVVCFPAFSTGNMFSRTLNCLQCSIFVRFYFIMNITITSNLRTVSSLEIAYFNPNTKDVIPGVSPQILQIKVQEPFLLYSDKF